MSFSRNNLLAAIFAFGTLAVVAHDAQACPPGRSSGYSRSYSSRSYSQPSYTNYSNHSYQNYSQPNYNSYQQPVQVIRQIQSVQPAAPQQVISQQAPFQQVAQTQRMTPQQQQIAPQQPQQPVTSPQQTQVAPQQRVAPQQPVARQQQPEGNPAAMSALQALGGFAPPATAQPPQQQLQPVQTPVHVGDWTATLGNGSTVKLSLQADGTFNWIATNKTGGTSSFSGSYTAGNGSLNLNRSNDNQQLGGSMTNNGNNAFSFKVAGNNAASINFNRS